MGSFVDILVHPSLGQPHVGTNVSTDEHGFNLAKESNNDFQVIFFQLFFKFLSLLAWPHKQGMAGSRGMEKALSFLGTGARSQPPHDPGVLLHSNAGSFAHACLHHN